MTDEQRRCLLRPVAGMLTGILPGLLLCVAIGGYLKSEARAETSLPVQDITVSGRVTAPTCTARLKDDRLRFMKSHTGVGEQREQAVQKQTLSLRLSQCEVDGIGVMFKAAFWADFPARGSLTDNKTQQYSTTWYYTVAPGMADDNATDWPLTLAADSPALETDRQAGTTTAKTGAGYFSLNEVNYWYDLRVSLKESDLLTVPFVVELHPVEGQGSQQEGDELETHFTLQLSYR